MAEEQITHLEYLEGNIVVIRLGSPSEKVVTLTVSRLASLRTQLIELEQKRPSALIITGPHTEMFTAGADINLIQGIREAAEGERFAREGQKVFDILERLPFPTIAAISGACVGGGCELVLACKYRIASDQKNTVIGLPEVKLGIIPGFGGTQRLPRLIGISGALEIICAGKTLNSDKALQIGLVDKVVPTEQLLSVAKDLALAKISVARRSWSLREKLLTNTTLGRKFVASKVLSKLNQGTGRFYSAPRKALESVIKGLKEGVVLGLDFEAKEIGTLITSEQSKNLVSLFFASEAAKSLGKAGRGKIDDLAVMVIGAGTMGAGIASVFASAGYRVVLSDTNKDYVEKGIQTIRKGLDRDKRLNEKKKEEILSKISIRTPESDKTESAISIVIEAIFEDIEVKKKVLGQICAELPGDVIIASNTSSLSVSEIAAALPNPERVVGMHFFNPAQKMPLIEIIRGKKTSDKVVVLLAALASRMGKIPVVVEDVPGFLVNRVLFPYLAEALKLLAEGYSADSIDKAALDFGMPMGPLRLLDEIGLDVADHVTKIMTAAYGDRMKGPDLLSVLLAKGRKGKKSGAGFFEYSADQSKAWPDLSAALNLPATKYASSIEFERRLFGAMQNEARLCYQEGVAGRPGAEALAQINLASVMGIGYPAFRGGVLGTVVP